MKGRSREGNGVSCEELKAKLDVEEEGEEEDSDA